MSEVKNLKTSGSTVNQQDTKMQQSVGNANKMQHGSDNVRTAAQILKDDIDQKKSVKSDMKMDKMQTDKKQTINDTTHSTTANKNSSVKDQSAKDQSVKDQSVKYQSTKDQSAQHSSKGNDAMQHTSKKV